MRRDRRGAKIGVATCGHACIICCTAADIKDLARCTVDDAVPASFRYFTEEAATLGCMIFGVRDSVGPGQVPMRDYWIPDGLYGSMNSLLYDHAVLSTHPLGAHPTTLRPLNHHSPNLQSATILRVWLLHVPLLVGWT